MMKLIGIWALSTIMWIGCSNGGSNNSTEKDTYTYEELDAKPRFGGCNDIKDLAKLKSCSDKKMSEFISKNLRYPEDAKAKGIQGKTLVSFIIERNGSLSDIKAVSNHGGGLEEEAVRVIELMNTQKQWWVPGEKNGKRQRVRLQLPINFKL